MNKRWWYLIATIIIFIIFIVISYYFFLSPTRAALESANQALDSTDQVIKGGCQAILNSNTTLVNIAPDTRRYCQQVLAS